MAVVERRPEEEFEGFDYSHCWACGVDEAGNDALDAGWIGNVVVAAVEDNSPELAALALISNSI